MMALPMAVNAQPSGREHLSGDEEGRFPGAERRLEVAADYLELTDGQRIEWEGILDRHRETVRGEWQDLAEIRQQFRTLADTDSPDLAELGGLALTLHRGTEAMHARRSSLEDELASILSPDQVEKLEALKTARETVRPRGKRGHPHRESRPDWGGGN
jgi:hypothetical protein